MGTQKLPSIRRQSILVLGLIVALLMIAAFDSINMTLNYALAKQNEENRQDTMQVAGNFQIHMNAIRTLMTSLSFDSSVQQVMVSRRLYGTSEGWDNFLMTLFSYSRLEAGIDSVLVADVKGKMYNYQYYQDVKAFGRAVEYACDHEGYSPCFTLGGKRMYTVSQPIYRVSVSQYASRAAKGTVIGTCVFLMDLDETQKQLNWQAQSDNHVMCILDAQGQIITQNQPLSETMQSYIDDHFSMISGPEEYIDAMQQGGSSYAVYGNQLGSSGWTLVCFTTTSIWSSKVSGILVRMIVTWLVVILLTLTLTGYLFRNIYGFVAHMQRHMRLVRDGYMDTKMPVWKKQEFAAVSDGFNEMMDRINSLTRQNLEIQTALYREELDKRQVALVALQSQVNPHFLYNTLECMKGIALCNDIAEIPVICESLARLMRYSIKGGALSTLGDELITVESYLSIQNIRFDNRYRLRVDVPERLEKVSMLKMVLQPLVENAILHGFEPKPGPGSIWIEAVETEDGRIRVTVADDGCGMDELALSALSEQLQNAPVGAGSGTSIGLLNVAQRLKLYYGGEGGLTVHSVLGQQGTRVEIVTPLAPCPGAPLNARKEAEPDV